MAAKINPMHTMAGPISGRQRAIVAVLRAGFVGPIGQHAKNGLLRAFHGQPRPWYTGRQLTHCGPVLGPLRPLIDTGRHEAREQCRDTGKNNALMTYCPSNIIPKYILSYYVIP